MYGPAPPRRKKTGITRSRTGCLSCRLRHKKCDEKRPACSDCVRLGKACQQPPSKLAFRTVSFQARDDTSFEDPLPDAVATREPADLSESSAGTPEAQSPLENDWDHAFGEDSTCLSPRMTADARLLPVAAARETGQTVFYSDFWESHCVPAIHPALGELGRHLTRPSFIKEAVLALAACRLSRMTPRRKPFDPKGTPGLSFRPDSGHQAVSCARYGTALTSLGRRINMPSAEDPGTVLAGIILLAHLESLMGNFPQFGLHSMGIERLLSHMRAASVKPDRLTCTLIANWNQIRAQNWWLRLHFSTPDFHCRTERMECSPWLTSVLEEADDSRAIIMSALCECCRLSSLAFLTCRDMDRANVTGPVKAVDPATTTAVDAQHAILDHWHDQLPLSELPIEAFVKAPDTTTEGFEVRPLQFTSHQAAMNYAYYVVSRVFLSVFAAESADEVANSWALLLARIAAGVDWDDCLKLNTFVIGFSSLFVPCALHSSDIRIGLWLQDWIEQRYTIASLEEGSFPVLQVLQPLRVINREHHDGRDVRALFACVEDGGGGAKYSSYNSQHLPSLLVCGQEISTGTCYSRIVAL